MKINTRPARSLRLNNRFVRYVLVAALFLLLFLLQTLPECFPRIGKASAYLLIPAVVSAAAHGGEIDGAIWGAVAGLLWDSVSAEVTGYHMMVLILAGFICGTVLRRSFRVNFVSVLFLEVVTSVVYVGLYWFFFIAMRGYAGAWRILVYVYLPSVVFTAVMFVPVYFLMKAVYRLGEDTQAGKKRVRYIVKNRE